jgi:thiol:disulfide interchange protein DsbA
MKYPKLISSCLILFGLLLSLPAQSATALTEGKEYTLVNPPLAPESGKNVEVVEFFWYGCPHCFNLEPALNTWFKTMPKDVTFRRVPGILRDSWTTMAKAYYTLETLGKLESLHTDLFKTIHVNNVNLDDEKNLFDWAASHGIDRKKFIETYNSFSVQSKVLRAKQVSRLSGIAGVPAVIVDGKFLTTVAMAGSLANFPGVLDAIIEKARQDRAAHK